LRFAVLCIRVEIHGNLTGAAELAAISAKALRKRAEIGG
jgi:hypothetical protein